MKSNLFKKFQKDKKGSVTIEFAFMLIFLCVMLIFMADLVLVRSTMGKLDSVSYSLVNIVRERPSFFGGSSTITSQDVEQLRKVGKKLLYGDANAKQKVNIVLEQLTHTNGKANSPVVLGDSNDCKAARPLATVPQLAPYSQSINPANRRLIPVYQVTICIEMLSPFKRFLLNDENKTEQHNIRSSSVAVSR